MSDSEASDAEVLDNLANERLEKEFGEQFDDDPPTDQDGPVFNKLKRLHQQLRKSPGDDSHSSDDSNDETDVVKAQMPPSKDRHSSLLSSSSRVMGGEQLSDSLKRSAPESSDSSEAEVEEEVRPPPVKVQKFENGNEPLKKRIAKNWDHSQLELLDQTAAQKSKPAGAYSDVALRMMQKHGYKDGSGLGATGQGISEPIQLSTQRGRRGLGMKIAGLETSHEIVWDQSMEQISIEETPIWMPHCSKDIPTVDELDGWMVVGNKKMTIHDETKFCSQIVLDRVLNSKSVFDQLGARELQSARTRANPFETIRGVFFQNRAAMKMANMDAVFDFMFTNPKGTDGKPLFHEESPDLLYFADVCAGPGGFTEYMLWKLKWNAHGFGFTLKNADDFKLDKFLAASPEMFEPFYGTHRDGDVTNPENLTSFRQFVRDSTHNRFISTFMADGGFSVEGQENIQEILSKRIYLCQFLCAISILRPGGNFVCKLFDLFTPFSVGLVYLMYRIFDVVCIHKPNTSRPANSERYIICKGLRVGSDAVHDYLFQVNEKLDELNKAKSTDDVVEVVPSQIIQEDEEFCQYMVDSNEELAIRQAVYLAKYKAFAQNPGLLDTRQTDLREKCLQYWQIPDLQRPRPPQPRPTDCLQELCRPHPLTWLNAPKPAPMQLSDLDNIFHFHCQVVTGDPCLMLALGRNYNFRWEGSRWDSLNGVSLQLPRDTFFLAEVAHEYDKDNKLVQRPTKLLRVFDAYFLGGVNISQFTFEKRQRLIQKFCKAISHQHSLPYHARVEAVETLKLPQLLKLNERLKIASVKGAERVFATQLGGSTNLAVTGLLFSKIVKEPWTIAYSRTNKLNYFFNCKTGKSSYEHVQESALDFPSTYVERCIWEWKSPTYVFEDQVQRGITLKEVVDHITEKLKEAKVIA